MKTIPLTQGKVALVDDADYEAVSQFKWCALKIGRRFYAVRNVRRPDGKIANQYMHRFLMPGAPEVDHRDGDGLNNQRNNLRPATSQQNHQGFKSKAAGKTSKFRGVSWRKERQKWRGHIQVDGKFVHLGSFKNEEDAARAYDAAARKYFGEFASPNFP